MSGEPVSKKPYLSPSGSAVAELYTQSLTELKRLMNDESLSLQLFKERLMMKEVPKGQSPLVAAVWNSRLDILKCILRDFPVNIEQETTFAHRGNDSSVTALWLASSLGDMECVKALVEGGADTEHKCSSPQVSPLWVAVYSGCYEVAIYLINNGADINHTHEDEAENILLEAVKDKELTQLLVAKGANVNYTGRDGNTPLHLCWHTDTAKIFVDAGAKNTLNDNGLSVVVNAAAEHSDSLVDYLIGAFQCGPRELYDVYCVQAVNNIIGPNLESYILKAVQVRSSHPDLFSHLSPANEIYDGIQEPATTDEFQAISQNKTKLYYLCSVYCERILGRNRQIMSVLRNCIMVTLDDGNYDKCNQFCNRYLELGANFKQNYQKCFLEIFYCVTVMLEDGHVPSIQPLIQCALKGVEHEKENNRRLLLIYVVRLVALWIKIADEYIKDSPEQEREHTHIKKAVQELIRTTGNDGATIIGDVCDMAPSEYSEIDLPLGKALSLLLDYGCQIQHRHPESGDFPLHLALNHRVSVAVDCARTLLEYGAHIDAVNFKNKTAKQFAQFILFEYYKPQVTIQIFDMIELFEAKPPTLQCLTARAIVEYNIKYKDYLSSKMAEFVSWHSSKQHP